MKWYRKARNDYGMKCHQSGMAKVIEVAGEMANDQYESQ
jgi:hypothetical protein